MRVLHANHGAERAVVPRRRCCGDGAAHAAPLASRVPVRGSRRARRHAGARAPARRRPGGLPRHRRPPRRARRALSAPTRVARVRAERGMRPALPLSRLEVRRRRQRRRHAFRSPGHRRAAWQEGEGLPGARRRRVRVDMDGAAGRAARMGPARVVAAPRDADRDRQDARRLQLGAGAGGLDRLGAQLQPALHEHAGGRGGRLDRHPTRPGCAPRTTRRPSCSSRRRATGSATRRSASRSATPRPTSTSAPRSSSRRSPC